MSMRVVIKTRRDTASNWTSVNPVLSLGEMGIETDTRKIKFGDGTTAWNGLQYISTSNGAQLILEDVDDRISELLIAGSGIILNYDDDGDMLTISTSGNISQFTNDVGYLAAETNDLTSVVTWSNVPDANITESSVVQHSGALRLTESQIVDLGNYVASGDNVSILSNDIGYIISDNSIVDGSEVVTNVITLTQSEYEATIPQSGVVYLISGGDIAITSEVNDLTSAVTWANVPDANITESSVVQHSGALRLTESQIVDLQPYLTSESNDLTASVTWANVPDANITESSVVQHSGALKITESQIVDLQPYLFNVVEDVTPQLGGDLDINNNDIIGTGNINIDGNASVNAVSFDLLADPTITAGMMGWNEAEGSLNVGLDGDVKIQVGEHTLFRIRNNTADTLYAGQSVYATGIHNNSLIEAGLYTADGSVREIRFMGLVLEDVAINQKGYAINFGHIGNIDTRGNGPVNGATNLYDSSEPAWVEGDILYVHPTAPGKLTKTEPTHSISVAIVLYVHQNQGKIFVRPTSYGHLGDNHDVALTVPISTNQVLAYGSSGSWINKTFDISLIQKGSIPFPFYDNTQMGYYYSWAVGTEAVVNEGSNDINFRVEGNSEQNLLFVDAGADKIGIGNNNPVYDLDVVGSGNFTDGIYINGATAVKSDVTGMTGASGINNIVQISQVDYDALGTYDPNTLYFIV